MNSELPIGQAPEHKLNTRQLEELLRSKYPRDRYALFFNVPDAVGVDQNRRIDAIACGVWKSVGREIEGFELKVSRSDWLREVKNVNKADPFIAVCDRFWLVTADQTIAKIEEIPACWGWLSATKTGLRVQRPASKLPGCGDNVPRAFMLGVLRKMQDDMISSPDVAAVIEERIKRITDRHKDAVKYATERIERERDQAIKAVKDFEELSGINLLTWCYGNVAEIVGSLKRLGVFGDGLETVPKLLEGHEKALRHTLERVIEVRQSLSSRTTENCKATL